MNLNAAFTAAADRRPQKRVLPTPWLLTLVLALALLTGQHASAASANGQARKVARDLQAALDAPTTTSAMWARDVNGQRQVQVVIISSSIDKEMTCAPASRAQAARCMCACPACAP